MAVVLFDNGSHQCVKFNDLTGAGEVQANQFIIVKDKRGILLDPGGNKLFAMLGSKMAKYCPPQRLEYLLLSHQDPDVGAGLNGWLLMTKAKILVSDLWTRFIPNFCTRQLAEGRVEGIPDNGMTLQFSDTSVKIIPAHFLHSPGNFHVYDPTSKILFTSDLGASVGLNYEKVETEEEFKNHIQYMEGFHKRYIPHSSACKFWAKMIKQLDIEMIVPQHGARFVGKEMVNMFINWINNLECGLEIGEHLFKINN